MEETFGIIDLEKFLKHTRNTKFECFYKMIFAYRLSRFELLNLEWKDIDFEKNEITIMPISYIPNDKTCKNYWDMKKNKELARTFPLLKNIRELLIKEKQKQTKCMFSNEDYDMANVNYVCVNKKGKRINANTLSRNFKYIARDNKLPDILISGLKNSAEDYLFRASRNPDYYRCWTRYDIIENKENIYDDFNLNRNKKFITWLNHLIEKASALSFHQEM